VGDAVKRSHWMLVLKAGLGALLFIALYRAAGARGMFATLRNAHASEFWMACGLMAVAFAFNGTRWWIVMRAIEQPISLRNALTATFESVFFQQLVPTGVGGDISRAVRAYDCGLTPEWAFIGVAIDRGLGLLFVCVSIIVAAVSAESSLTRAGAFEALLVTSIVVVAGAAFAVVLGAFSIPRWALIERAGPLLALLRAYSGCMRSYSCLARVLICLVLSTGTYVVSFFFCARALDVHIGAWDATIVIQGMALVSILPISIGGWGLRESAALMLFAPLGVDATHALAVSVLFGLVLTVLACGGAVVWFMTSYRRLAMDEAVNNSVSVLQREATAVGNADGGSN
jgi:glycosyltransferase 2 family protein